MAANIKIENTIIKTAGVYPENLESKADPGIHQVLENNQKIQSKRRAQNQDWLKKLFNELVENKIKQNPKLQEKWQNLNQNILEEKQTPLSAAQDLISILFN